MRRLLIIPAACAAAALLTFASPANASINYLDACHVVDDGSNWIPETQYYGNPLRGKPYDQAKFILRSWGADASPMYWSNTASRPSANRARCVINYYDLGAFNVQWHVVLEVNIYGDGTSYNDYENTGRSCYGINQYGQLVAPPDCKPYGDPFTDNGGT